MYATDKVLSKSIYLNKVIEIIQKTASKYKNKEEVSYLYKRDRLEYIRTELKEIEESISNYNQYKEVVKDNEIEINIKKLEKLYENIIE